MLVERNIVVPGLDAARFIGFSERVAAHLREAWSAALAVEYKLLYPREDAPRLLKVTPQHISKRWNDVASGALLAASARMFFNEPQLFPGAPAFIIEVKHGDMQRVSLRQDIHPRTPREQYEVLFDRVQELAPE